MLLLILYIVSALDALCLSMVITTITPYVFSLGGTQFYLGILGSTFSFINLVWNPIVGSLSDTLGRKNALLQCLFLCLIGNFLVTCSASLTVFFISRIFSAFGTPIKPLLSSLMDDNIKSKEAKMAAINKMQALGRFSFIVGSLVSGQLSGYDNGTMYTFYLISAMFVINIALISLIKDNQVKKPVENKPQTSFSFFSEIKKAGVNLSNVDWPKYWDLFIIKLIIDFALNVFQFNNAVILMKRFDMGAKAFSYIFASISVIGIVTNLVLMKVKKYFSGGDESGFGRLLLCKILMIITFLGLGLSSTFPLYMLSLVFGIVGRVLYESTFTEVILGRASPQEKGSIMGTFEATLSIGGLTAPILSGMVASSWGQDASVLVCVVPLIFGTILVYSQKRQKID